MDSVQEREESDEKVVPDVTGFKQMIAKVIFFKQMHSLARPMFPAFQGSVAIYTVALAAMQYGRSLDLMRIWEHQGISEPLKNQLRVWGREVNAKLHATSAGRMISERAKKEDCWTELQKLRLTPVGSSIPEFGRAK